ncbi:unnamed protein product [Cuscuta epithymum]|uniref:Retrovirus-related Pol polyprotein from transposon TNT 1-94 n=1 Tax=Cuscuta epithymum TaxID=186058 RepID=A0AAV0FWL9_9ASTE|nr:unnamed protein product [Cuscuta epithymum]
MSAFNQYGMAPFNGKTDFSIWKQKIKCILIQQKSYRAISQTYLTSDTEEKKAEMNESACSIIYLNLSDCVLRKVGILESAKSLWDKLEELYTETSLPSRMFLLEKFFKFRLDMSKDIEENLDVFTKLISDIKLSGDKHIDDYTPIALLNAIPDSYSDVKSAIKYGRDNITLDIVVNGLKSKELDLKQSRGSKNSGEVMHVRGRPQNRSHNKNYASNGESSFRKNSANRKGRSKSRSKARKCYNCHEFGHFIKDCPKPKKNQHNEHANVAFGEEKMGDIFMVNNLCDHACVNSVLSNSLCESDWLVDSGCTFHMTPFENLFSNYKKIENGYVSMANEKKCNVLGTGDVCLRFSSGSVFTLKDVRHVPDLRYNLLSCASLENEGFEGKWGKGVMKIMKGSLVIFTAEKKNNLYVCQAEPVPDYVYSVIGDKSILWHNRLGHMSNKGLDILHKNGHFGSDKLSPIEFCESCVLGKQHRVSFPISTFPNQSKCVDILEYLHADVWGPSSVPTQGGNQYFLSIIDDYSRKVWVLLMKQKSEVFEKFKNWKIMIENQTGKKIKALRTDNGLEFCNKQMNDLCATWGIKRHKSVPYTPQQNGVAERMNRSLLERVRAMLATSGLSKKFWGETLNTAAYLINRSPSVPLGGKCPESVFTGKKLDLTNLRVFGCAGYVHQKIDKLEPRSKKCVFLGYPEGVKGYRLWDRSEPGFKVVISRDVIFNENEFPCLTLPVHVPHNDAPNEVEQVPVKFQSEFSAKNDLHENVLENQGESTSNEVEHDIHDENVFSENDDLHDYQLARDRDRRVIRKPERYRDCNLINCDISEFAFNIFESLECNEPRTFKEALKSKYSKEWISAMNSEMESLKINQTWKLVPRPASCSLVDCKWLFKVKQESENVRFKARLVAKGFTQKEGIDYAEIFAPVVKFTTIRIILALVAHFNWELKQMDVTTAFLHGDLDKNIYMHQPEGFVDPKLPDHVCLLKKALYGLKQSPRQWNIKFDKCMQSLKFSKSSADHCLYYKNIDSTPIFLLLYVDDMLIVSPCLKSIEHVQKSLCENFDMKDLGDARKILGISIIRDRKKSTLVLNQRSYIDKVLSKFSMSGAKSVNVPLASHFVLSKDQSPKTETEMNEMKNVPYSNAIGSVMYLMVSTRPDIAYAVSCLSRYMSNPGMPHWNALKWLLRYLKYSVDVGLTFSKCSEGVKLIGYVDSNYANDRDNRKSTTSYVFTLCGSCVSWKSQLQPIVALSTTESEYVAATEAFKEAIWLRGLLHEINFLDKNVVIFSDSQSAIQLCKNPVFHDRTKHIDVKFHYIRDIVEKGIIKLEKIPSEFNPADMGTKCLPVEKFVSCQKILNFDFG